MRRSSRPIRAHCARFRCQSCRHVVRRYRGRQGPCRRPGSGYNRRGPRATPRRSPVLRALSVSIAALAAAAAATTAPARPDYPITAVPFADVQIQDAFWGPRQETNRTATIPYAFRMCEETGRIDNFMVAGKLKPGKFVGYRYNDSDVYKVMEAAAYSLRVAPRPAARRLPRPADLVHRGGAGARRLPLHAAHHRPEEHAAAHRPDALLVPRAEPRAVQRRPHVRGGGRALPGHRQALVPRRRDQERRPRLPHLRSRAGAAQGRARPRGDRDRPGQAVPRDRRARST